MLQNRPIGGHHFSFSKTEVSQMRTIRMVLGEAIAHLCDFQKANRTRSGL
jgi:hypothetical protein